MTLTDHFFDINPLDQAQFDLNKDQFGFTKDQQAWQNTFDETQFNYNKLKAERDQALAQGDLDLARKKQDDMNFWAQKNNQLTADITNANNATTLAGKKLDASTSLTNSKINSDDSRAIAGASNQLRGYEAETARGKDMGQLALDNNKFILDKSTSPRDLLGLYMMQRGITPDWGSLTAGGAPTIGSPLTVKDPFSFFNPTVQMPSNFNIGPGAAYNSADSVMNQSLPDIPQVTVPQANAPGGMPQQPYYDINPGGTQGGVPAAALRPGMNLSTWGGTTPGTGADFNTGSAYYDQGRTRPIGATDAINPGQQVWIDYGGQAAAGGARPGVQATEQPQIMPDGTVRHFAGTDMPRYFTGTGRQGGMGQKMQNTALDYGTQSPGFTRAPVFMAGDAAAGNPYAGGAKPEMIENPTGAPIRVKNTWQTAADFGMRKPGGFGMPTQGPMKQEGGFLPDAGMMQPQPQFQGQDYGHMGVSMGSQPPQYQGVTPMVDYGFNPYTQMPRRFADGTDSPGIGELLGALANQLTQRFPQFADDLGHDRIAWRPRPGMFDPNVQLDPSQIEDMRGGGRPINQAPYPGPVPPPRYAMGTDVSGQYAAAGMGDQYIQSSSNPGVQRGNLAPNMQTLYDYGVPLAPSLVNGTSGQSVDQANLASAFGQRGGGTLTSLQGYNNMSPGEQGLYEGYTQGVTGIPWADVLDYLGKPTQNLGTAQRSRSGMMF